MKPANRAGPTVIDWTAERRLNTSLTDNTGLGDLTSTAVVEAYGMHIFVMQILQKEVILALILVKNVLLHTKPGGGGCDGSITQLILSFRSYLEVACQTC